MEPLIQIDPVPVGMETQPMSHTLPHRPSPGGPPPVGQPAYPTGGFPPPPGSAVSASQSQGFVPQYPPGPPSGNQYPAGPPPSGGNIYPTGPPPPGDGSAAMGPPYAPSHPTFAPPPPLQQPSSFAAAPGTALDQPGGSFTQGLRASQATAESALREYLALQHRRRETGGLGLEEPLRQQARTAVQDLSSLRRDVLALAKAAERHRWRRWLIGGVLGTFIPGVKRLFRRPEEDRTVAANDTEYAFARSKTLVARILDSVHGKSGLASVAFFVFAVLYVFQSEVSLRVAKTVAKRLKRLRDRIERGDEDIAEKDVELLKGWRWRILLWSE